MPMSVDMIHLMKSILDDSISRHCLVDMGGTSSQFRVGDLIWSNIDVQVRVNYDIVEIVPDKPSFVMQTYQYDATWRWFTYLLCPYIQKPPKPILLLSLDYNGSSDDNTKQYIDMAIHPPLSQLYHILGSHPLYCNTLVYTFDIVANGVVKLNQIEVYKDETIKAMTEPYKIVINIEPPNTQLERTILRFIYQARDYIESGGSS